MYLLRFTCLTTLQLVDKELKKEETEFVSLTIFVKR